ncbi:MAG: primosomal protein N' [Flavobacteriia bacterium]|nr:primosomal protein N' [Flavobacteriia bacterium]
MDRKTLFVDVIVPLPVKNLFTYRVPFELNDFVKEGVRVIVPFGKSKLYTAIVVSVHENVPQNYAVKFIENILDDSPIVHPIQIKFWQWMSLYYMSPIGEVMNVALPSNFKLASETKITLHPDYEDNLSLLNERQYLIFEALTVQESLDLKEISEIVGIKTIQPLIKEMIEWYIVQTLEEVKDKFQNKTEKAYILHQNYQNEESLSEILDELAQKHEKQFHALLTFLKLQNDSRYLNPVFKKHLSKEEVSASSLQTLEKREILISEKITVSRLKGHDKETLAKKNLSTAQKKSFDEIKEAFNEKNICLLHGITGSGKTEIYVELIEEQIKLGKQILFLLPEIALTTQLIERLSLYFGDLVGVYHSKFNQNERIEIWHNVLKNNPDKFRIILGARSSLFLPYQDLGLIIVDEEHETSFKQYDPAPRYHARDCAIVLAQLHKTKVLLGSATPSFESYYNAKQGKYALVKLNERYSQIELPEIFLVDLKKEKEADRMHSHFSKSLLDEVEIAIKDNEQVILFQNRRGFTTVWACEVCNNIAKCKNCDVSLTYHKQSNSLKCHYCSYVSPPIGSCSNCGSNRLRMLGFGTEKIEDELRIIFPDYRIERLDLDSTRNKYAYQQIIQDFEDQKIHILIGTQMISKGLDFDNVNLVGVLDADGMMNRPDFRAYERSFQLMTQVAGRAGRRNKRGKVLIQTQNTDHWVLKKVCEHDFISFYDTEITERINFFWPPYFKLIHFSFKTKDYYLLDKASHFFAEQLKEVFKERVLGPQVPLISRINNLFLKQVVLKLEKDVPITKVRQKIDEIIELFFSEPTFKSVQIAIDVDPN